MLKKDMPTGIILFEGKSRLNKQPIVAIATGFKSVNNHKTGKMLQVWILPKDIHPAEARKTCADFSICGDCKHRQFKSCYVELLRGPITVWNVYKGYKDGDYVKWDSKRHSELFKDSYIRLGAYGDPVAIPLATIEKICKNAAGWTGYTHQWKKAKAKNYKKYLMASVDSIKGYYKEYHKATAAGWRSFRIREQDDTVLFDNEFICPASEEGGKLTTCEKCGACSGAFSKRKNPVIKIHGFRYKIMYYTRGMKAIKNKKKYVHKSNNPVQQVVTEIEQEISQNVTREETFCLTTM